MHELIFGKWPEGQPIPWAEWTAFAAERRPAVGELNVPCNTGNRRTDSRKALLQTIEEAGGVW
jgi:hypothetical protein